ncbi:MAG: hypothetical protein Q7U34_07760 [Anaerolineales bacterium]|nr:hypothetical protein [Anaerolineales bacterium]
MESLLAALRVTDWAEILAPLDFGLEPILAVHRQGLLGSAGYLDYLPKAYSGRKYGDTAGVFRLVSFQVEWGHG